MALNLQCGTITQPGATGNQTTNLAADFDPKVLIMWAVPRATEGISAQSASFSMGMATYRGAAVQHGYVAYYSEDAGGSSVVATGIDDTSILRLFSDGTVPTVDLEIDFVSFATGASSAFTINWVNLHTTASILVKYLVLGGSDITDALVHTFNLSTAVATQDVTVASGFGQPDLLMWMSGANYGSGLDSAASALLTFGAAKSNTERFCATFNDEDAANAMLCAVWMKQRAILSLNPNDQTADAEADLSAKASWPTDGYQLTYADQAALASFTIGLALKGTFTSKVTSVNSPTTISNTDVDHGSVPKGALMFNAAGYLAADTTIVTSGNLLGAFGLGGLDGTNEVWAGAGNDDSDGNADTAVVSSATKAAVVLDTHSTAQAFAEADGSITGNNVRLAWTTVDGTNSFQVGVVTFGSSTGPAALARDPQVVLQAMNRSSNW